MAIHKSPILKFVATTIRVVQLLAAIVILAVLSTYLARLSTRNQTISQAFKGAEGIAGATVLYTAFAVLLTCCLGGKAFFAFLAIALDVLFCGGMIAIAIITRGYGTSKCDYPDAPKTKRAEERVVVLLPRQLRADCSLVKSAFAVSIITAFLFIISAALQRSVQQASVHAMDTHHTNPRARTVRNPFKRKAKTTHDAEMATHV
ncbi:MAG: hypothetical protein M1814_003123 [Vezdaea aestivalis]|nr:MAG: hypothetical protein M1814_003123 [Vezdaea aestivalis]